MTEGRTDVCRKSSWRDDSDVEICQHRMHTLSPIGASAPLYHSPCASIPGQNGTISCPYSLCARASSPVPPLEAAFYAIPMLRCNITYARRTKESSPFAVSPSTLSNSFRREHSLCPHRGHACQRSTRSIFSGFWSQTRQPTATPCLLFGEIHRLAPPFSLASVITPTLN